MEVDFLKSIIVFLFVLSGSAVSGQLTYRELADVIRMDSDSLERQLDSLFRQTGESGSDSLLALAQCYRGILACRTGSCFVAADAFDVALAYSPHSDYAGLVWSELGFCFEGQGNYDRAILATEESLEWATSRNDTMAMVASRISLGRQKMRVGDQAGALTDLEMAAVMLNGRRGVWSEIGQINYHFSVVSQSVDRTHLGSPLSYAEQARSAFEQAGDTVGVVKSLLAAVRACIADERAFDCTELLGRAERLANALTLSDEMMAMLYGVRGELLLSQRQFLEAIGWFRRSTALYRKIMDIEQHSEQWRSLLKALAGIGDLTAYDAALADFTAEIRVMSNVVMEKRRKEFVQVYRSSEKEDELMSMTETARLLDQSLAAAARKAQRQNLVIVVFVVVLLILTLLAFITRNRYINKRLRFNLFRTTQALFSQPSVKSPLQDSEDQAWKVRRQLFERLCEVVQKDKMYLRGDLTVDALAAALATNNAYVSKAIKAHTNGNFNQYINTLRVREAVRLLDSGFDNGYKMTLSELAQACGFNSYNTFARVFKQVVGQTPSQYVNMRQGGKSTGGSSSALILLVLVGVLGAGGLCQNHARAQLPFEQIRQLIPAEINRAQDEIGRYTQTALQLGSDSLLARSYYLKGLIGYYRGQFTLAAANYEKALKLPTTHADLDLSDRLWNNLGIAYELANEHDRALEAFEKSLEYARLRNDAKSIAQTRGNLGVLSARLRYFDEGRAYLHELVDYASESADSLHLFGFVYSNYSSLFNQEAIHWDSARYYAELALEKYDALGDVRSSLSARNNLAFALIELDLLGKADTLLREQALLCRQFEPEGGIHSSYLAFYQGDLWMKRGEPSKALTAYRQSLMMAKQQNHIRGIENTYEKILRALAASGDYDDYLKTDSAYRQDMAGIRSALSVARYSELKYFYDDLEQQRVLREKREEITWLEMQLDQMLIQSSFLTRLAVALLIALLLLIVVPLLVRGIRQNANLRKRLFRNNELIQLNRSGQLRTGIPALFASLGDLRVRDSDKETTQEQVKEEFNVLYERIIAGMEEDALYKRSDLTLDLLAAQMGSNTAYVSQVINARSGLHFNAFVNQYRTREAIRLLETEGAGGRQMMNEIAFNSGFNSYRTFFRTFKGYTGLSPHDYLRFYLAF